MSSSKPSADQRQLYLLGGLGVVLAGLVVFFVLPLFGDGTPASTGAARPAARPAPAAKPAAAAARGRGAKPALGPVEQVALTRLDEPWPDVMDGRRSPFSMVPDPPPPPPPPTAAQLAERKAAAEAAQAAAQPVGPPPPPPVPPITLKFIGVMSGPTQIGRIAALSDGKFVYHGKEGQIIEGRYRIVRIGEESIQVEYADGRGRQTIRLSGK